MIHVARLSDIFEKEHEAYAERSRDRNVMKVSIAPANARLDRFLPPEETSIHLQIYSLQSNSVMAIRQIPKLMEKRESRTENATCSSAAFFYWLTKGVDCGGFPFSVWRFPFMRKDTYG
jgi:hypothetical protein